METLLFIAKQLVDNPDKVVVETEDKADALIMRLKVADSDMGKVIGKQGRIAKAIRSVVKAASTSANKRVSIEITQ